MDGQKKSVLIVEDEPDNSEILRTVVEDILDHRARVVQDGAMALSAIRQEKPSLILMDIVMPVLDGFAAIKQLKTDPGTADIPIIAITALTRPSDRTHAIELGANDYVAKPFQIEELIGVIERTLETN